MLRRKLVSLIFTSAILVECNADSLHLFSPTAAPSIQAKTLGVSPK